MSDNEENCDYTLNQILHAALLSRGYTVREEEGKLLPAFKIPVAFDTLAYINSRNNGSTVTRLDVETRLPDGRLLYEAYGDIGGSIGRPTLKFAGGKPQCPTEPLIGAVKEALKRTRIGNAIHFVRFYYCQINGEAESVEFMLDNQNLPFAEQALARLDWPKREAFYSLRLFFILIPEKAV